MDLVNRNHSSTAPLHKKCFAFLGNKCLAVLGIFDSVRVWVLHGRELRLFSKEENDLRRDRLDIQMHDTQGPWTLQTAFYATSGTCVHRSKYTTGKTMETLDLETLKLLASRDPESLLPVKIAASQNPGQSSGIVKIITCVQAVWFCSQCIARMSNGLAISLLELNTFAHCISAFFIYGFWWYKPYDITSHTFIQSDMLDFLFLRRTAVSTSQRLKYTFGDVGLCAHDGDGARVLLAVFDLIETPGELEETTKLLKISHKDVIPGTEFSLVAQSRRGLPADENRVFFLPEQSLIHWQRLWCFTVETSFATAGVDKLFALSQPEARLSNIDTELLTLMMVFPLRLDSSSTIKTWSIQGIILPNVAFLLYGGLHLLAWQYHFRSKTEAILWKVSGVLTASSGVASSVLVNLYWISADTTVIFLLLMFAWTVVNMAARTYLFIESFIALPNSPASTYQIPNWMAYIPHV